MEKLLARRPDHREARLLLAELLLAEDNAQAAYRHAKAALDAYPNDAQTQYTMGLTFDAQGKSQEALAYYERAAKMSPQDETFAVAYQSARQSIGEKIPFSTAAMRIPDVADQRPDACLPLEYAAAKASGANLRTGAAFADYNGATAASPADALLHKGEQALAEGDPDAALQFFSQAAAANPDNPQIPISGAACALRSNRPQLAVALLTPAAKQFPNSAAVHRMLGAAFYRTGDFKSSQVALQQALSLDKSSALSYLLLGWTLAKLGQNEAAEAHFRQAQVLDSRYKIVR